MKHQQSLISTNFHDRLKSLLNTTPLGHLPCEFIIAFSGGLDSTVLLHLMSSIRHDLPQSSLKAIYIDHGLQNDSTAWGKHCERACAHLKVSFSSVSLDAVAKKGDSPEEGARKARYAYLQNYCQQKNSVLLTAHHANDQTETLLLQLLRGSGPKGLASMPVVRPFAQGHHLRPLLVYERASLAQYASLNRLQWVDDPSNSVTDFDRNFLRHKIVPVLKDRWPAIHHTSLRSAQLAADADELLNDLAAIDFEFVKCSSDNTLHIAALKQLKESRCRNVIRYWISLHGVKIPSYAQTVQILNMLYARMDSTPLLALHGCQIRRHRLKLYLIKTHKKIDVAWALSFEPSEHTLLLPDRSTLTLSLAQGEGLDLAKLFGKKLLVRYRRGGEVCTPVGRKQRHRLKKLFNEADIPPWERERIPLVFVDNLLVAVVGQWYCEPFALAKTRQEKGLVFKVLSN